MNIRFEIVTFDEKFLDFSYQWLQIDKELKWLTVTPNFTKEAQQEWFKRIKDSRTYKIYGISVDGKPAGAFGIKNIQGKTGEYWGYIAKREYWGKGLGKELMRSAFCEARKLNLNKLFLYVRNLENKRAINLYLSVGFLVDEITESYLKMSRQI